MQIHNLTRKHKNIKQPAVGRGGRRGKTSGRGHKGQKARAGHRIRPEIRDTIKKFPKLRGYRFSASLKPTVVNLDDLEKWFEAGATVDPTSLLEKELIRREGGALPQVKILGDGELTKKFTVTSCSVSSSARQAIEKAGGTITS